MSQPRSRRSFLGELLQIAAGGWVGLTALPTLLSGCRNEAHAAASDPRVAEYGVRRPDPGTVSKYGVREPRPKYGVQVQPEPMPPQPQPQQASPPGPDAGVQFGLSTGKTGGQPQPAPPPTDDNTIARPKYGVLPTPAPAYGVRPVPRYGIRRPE